MTVSIPELKKNAEMLLQAISQLENERKEPCPLEEGKEVSIDNHAGVRPLSKYFSETNATGPYHGITIQLDDETLILRLKYSGRGLAIQEAKLMQAACGGKSD